MRRAGAFASNFCVHGFRARRFASPRNDRSGALRLCGAFTFKPQRTQEAVMAAIPFSVGEVVILVMLVIVLVRQARA
jgi:hypothetical protein